MVTSMVRVFRGFRRRWSHESSEDLEDVIIVSKPTDDTYFGICFQHLQSWKRCRVLYPGAHCGAAGIRADDEVLKINDVRPFDKSHACQLMREAPAGDVRVCIRRQSSAQAVAQVEHTAKRRLAWRPEVDVIVDKFPQWVCPLTLEVFRDPVVAADGHTYERASIESWLAIKGTSPLNGEPLKHCFVADNVAVRSMIEQWVEENHV